MSKIESEIHFKRQSRAITLYLFAKIYPSRIPRHSFPISTLIASLKKIGKKMLQAKSENDGLTDGGTDRHSKAIFWMEGIT